MDLQCDVLHAQTFDAQDHQVDSNGQKERTPHGFILHKTNMPAAVVRPPCRRSTCSRGRLEVPGRVGPPDGPIRVRIRAIVRPVASDRRRAFG